MKRLCIDFLIDVIHIKDKKCIKPRHLAFRLHCVWCLERRSRPQQLFHLVSTLRYAAWTTFPPQQVDSIPSAIVRGTVCDHFDLSVLTCFHGYHPARRPHKPTALTIRPESVFSCLRAWGYEHLGPSLLHRGSKRVAIWMSHEYFSSTYCWCWRSSWMPERSQDQVRSSGLAFVRHRRFAPISSRRPIVWTRPLTVSRPHWWSIVGADVWYLDRLADSFEHHYVQDPLTWSLWRSALRSKEHVGWELCPIWEL